MYRDLKALNPSNPKYADLKQNLSVLNGIIQKEIRREKKNYFTRTFEKYKNDLKNTWKTISRIINKSKNSKLDLCNS